MVTNKAMTGGGDKTLKFIRVHVCVSCSVIGRVNDSYSELPRPLELEAEFQLTPMHPLHSREDRTADPVLQSVCTYCGRAKSIVVPSRGSNI